MVLLSCFSVSICHFFAKSNFTICNVQLYLFSLEQNTDGIIIWHVCLQKIVHHISVRQFKVINIREPITNEVIHGHV